MNLISSREAKLYLLPPKIKTSPAIPPSVKQLLLVSHQVGGWRLVQQLLEILRYVNLGTVCVIHYLFWSVKNYFRCTFLSDSIFSSAVYMCCSSIFMEDLMALYISFILVNFFLVFFPGFGSFDIIYPVMYETITFSVHLLKSGHYSFYFVNKISKS